MFKYLVNKVLVSTFHIPLPGQTVKLIKLDIILYTCMSHKPYSASQLSHLGQLLVVRETKYLVPGSHLSKICNVF